MILYLVNGIATPILQCVNNRFGYITNHFNYFIHLLFLIKLIYFLFIILFLRSYIPNFLMISKLALYGYAL